MKGRDKNLDVRVPDEPEEEKPVGTGESEEFELGNLADDPYADDMPFRLARAGVPRWVWIGVIVLILAAVLIVLIALRLRIV